MFLNMSNRQTSITLEITVSDPRFDHPVVLEHQWTVGPPTRQQDGSYGPDMQLADLGDDQLTFFRGNAREEAIAKLTTVLMIDLELHYRKTVSPAGPRN